MSIVLSLMTFSSAPAQAAAAPRRPPHDDGAGPTACPAGPASTQRIDGRCADDRSATVLRRRMRLLPAVRLLQPQRSSCPHRRQQVDRPGRSVRREHRAGLCRGRGHRGARGPVAAQPRRDLPDQQAQAPRAVVPQPAGRGVRSVMAMDSPARRMVLVLGCPPGGRGRHVDLARRQPGHHRRHQPGRTRVRGFRLRRLLLGAARRADRHKRKIPGTTCRGSSVVASRGDRGGAGGNRTRVLERRTRSSPGAVNEGGFSAPALALTRRRRAQSGKSPGHSS